MVSFLRVPHLSRVPELRERLVRPEDVRPALLQLGRVLGRAQVLVRVVHRPEARVVLAQQLVAVVEAVLGRRQTRFDSWVIIQSTMRVKQLYTQFIL